MAKIDGQSCRHPGARHVAGAALGLIVGLPAVVSAICNGGFVSPLAPPAVTPLHSYRAAFAAPGRLAVDGSGVLHIADPGLARVITRAPNGRVLSSTDGLGHPVSVAVDGDARIYVGDDRSGSVTVHAPDWRPLFQLGRGAGELSLPNDISVDASSGTVYVVDSVANVVRLYDDSGRFLSSFGAPGTGDGQFNFPTAIAVDPDGRRIFVADQLNYRIQIFDLDGGFLSCFGTRGSGPGMLDMPQALALDARGRLYVADSFEGRIQLFDADGGFLRFIGEFGDAASRLRIPSGLAIDGWGRLFVSATNNGRLEIYGIDPYSDPESVLPANVRVQPDPVERTRAAEWIDAIVEVAGYRVEEIAAASLVANGVPASGPALVGDANGNGIADLLARFRRSDLLATLPASGAARIAVAGRLGSQQFEGTTTVQISTCGAGAACPLGDADPQCNEAICDPTSGCSVRARTDGTGCEDGDACSVEDMCRTGVCEGAALDCSDANPCTTDGCDPVVGCVNTFTSTACGESPVARYAALVWPPDSDRRSAIVTGTRTFLEGTACGASITVGSLARVAGDAVAWTTAGLAVQLRRNSQIAGSVVTDGGEIKGVLGAVVGGRIDQSPGAAEVAECFTARQTVQQRRAQLAGLPVTAGLAFDALRVSSSTTRELSLPDPTGGLVVIDAAELRLGDSSSLLLAGSPAVATLVVRVHGETKIGRRARIEAVGVPPERILFLVDGSVRLLPGASVAGTLLAAGDVRLGGTSAVSGAVFGRRVRIAQYASVSLHPFDAWALQP